MTLEVVSPTAALLDGRYLLQDRVGRGGMATVYRAEDTHLGRTVAIKMIHESDDGPISADRAHTEKALLAALNHPSLVALYDAQLEPHRPRYLVMEFIDGPTLAALMAEGTLAPRALAHILQDLADGLAAVHAAGVVHRDVKPSNVLLASTGDPDRPWSAKLADFGIACALDRSRMTGRGVVLGTLAYMAPEQLRDTDPGTPVDIFALGIVMLEALTGESGYPSLGSDRASAVTRATRPPSLPDDIDEHWRALLDQMTRLDAAERPDAAAVARTARSIAATSAATPLVAPPAPSAAHRSDADAGTTAPTAVLPTAAGRGARRRIGVASALTLTVAAAVAVGAAIITQPAGVVQGGLMTSVTSLDAGDVTDPVDPAPDAVDPEPALQDQQDLGTADDDRGNRGKGSGEDRGDGSSQGNSGKGNNGNGNGNGNEGNGGTKDDKGKGG